MELKQKKLELLSSFLGEYETLKDPQVRFFCPNCNHHKKKLEVNLDTNQFQCWVCHYSGQNVEKILRTYAHQEVLIAWYEIIRGEHYDGSTDLRALLEVKPKPKELTSEVELPLDARPLAMDIPSTVARHALQFLRKRDISFTQIRTYDLRYCDTGKFENRIIIPGYNEFGQVNFFLGRAIFDDGTVRYLNSKVRKDDIIFNELFVTWERPIILTEGFFDAIAIGENSIPLLGSTLSENSMLFKKIMHYKPEVILFLDNDSAGQEATIKIAKLLSAWDTDLWFIPWGESEKKDPGELKRNEAREMLKKKKRFTAAEVMRKILE